MHTQRILFKWLAIVIAIPMFFLSGVKFPPVSAQGENTSIPTPVITAYFHGTEGPSCVGGGCVIYPPIQGQQTPTLGVCWEDNDPFSSCYVFIENPELWLRCAD